VFEISALARQGLDPLIHAIYDHVAAHRAPVIPEPDTRFEASAEVLPKPDEELDPRFRRD
jgi:GTP-binding protein